jgi:hypothetical protein
MIGIAARAPEALVERARRLYTGVDPDTRARLTVADAHRMTGEAIAIACDVHPHTVDGWINRFGWRRPPWYRQQRGRRQTPPGAVMAKLRATIETAADTGRWIPDNFRLSRELGCSVQAIRKCLCRLREAGELRSERDGPRRRLVLKDGRTTGWTELPRQGGSAASPVVPAERRSLSARVLGLVTELARDGRPMLTDRQGGRLLHCDPSTFRRALFHLRESRQLTVEHRSGSRRFVLPNGTATGWSVPQLRMKPLDAAHIRALPAVRRSPAPLDLAVEEAVRALRRQGPVVFDLSVVTHCAPGVAWSVDGRTMNRAQLLAEAADCNARAMQRLLAVADGAVTR